MLSDTVILNSPTTTERDRAAVDYLERVLALDAREFGREMFQATSDVSPPRRTTSSRATPRSTRRAASARSRWRRSRRSGRRCATARASCWTSSRPSARRAGTPLMALMVTDILAKGTKLLVAGDLAPVERAFGQRADGGVLDLPGVMSRKKQVVPPLLAAV